MPAPALYSQGRPGVWRIRQELCLGSSLEEEEEGLTADLLEKEVSACFLMETEWYPDGGERRDSDEEEQNTRAFSF